MAGYLTEAWPILAALAFLVVLTFGALRPYIKRSAAPKPPPSKDDSND